jgi:hypothetical protein
MMGTKTLSEIRADLRAACARDGVDPDEMIRRILANSEQGRRLTRRDAEELLNKSLAELEEAVDRASGHGTTQSGRFL